MILGLERISSEKLTNEAIDALERVSNFKSYLLSNNDIRILFDFDGKQYSVDFKVDDDDEIIASKCSCSAERCIHKTLALIFYNYQSGYEGEEGEMAEELEQRLAESPDGRLIDLIMDFYFSEKLSYDDIMEELDELENEQAGLDECDPSVLDKALEEVFSFSNFKKGKKNTEEYLTLIDTLIPNMMSFIRRAYDNGMYDEADLIGENLEKTIEFIAQNSHHAEEYVQAELVNSLLYILREDEESFDVVSAALRNAFNSTEYLKKHKKEMLKLEIKRAGAGSRIGKKLKKLLTELES